MDVSGGILTGALEGLTTGGFIRSRFQNDAAFPGIGL
jgi:hypothetical protein